MGVELFHGTAPETWAIVQADGLLPMRRQFAGMTDEELRALVSLDDAKMLNAMYRGVGPAVPNNATAPVRVDLSQLVIDAWSRK